MADLLALCDIFVGCTGGPHHLLALPLTGAQGTFPPPGLCLVSLGSWALLSHPAGRPPLAAFGPQARAGAGLDRVWHKGVLHFPLPTAQVLLG